MELKLLVTQKEGLEKFGYTFRALSGERMYLLGQFLEEIGWKTIWFRKKLLTLDDEPVWMEKLVVERFFSYNFRLIDLFYVEISVFDDGIEFYEDTFVEFLVQWSQLFQRRPQSAVIVYDEGRCWIEDEVPSDSPYPAFDNQYWPVVPQLDLYITCVLELDEYGFYSRAHFLADSAGTLADFLMHDLAYKGAQHIKEWAQSADRFHFSGEWSLLVKKSGMIVIKDFMHLEGKNRYVAIPQENFLALLEDWEIVEMCKPAIIVVRYENGKIELDSAGRSSLIHEEIRKVSDE